MKILRLLIFLLVASNHAIAQNCMSIDSYEASGKEVVELDSLYPSAMHIDSTIAVFYGREKEFYSSWVGLLNDLASHLSENDFKWEVPTRCFNRVYFNADGSVNTYLFNFLSEDVDSAKQERFTLLTNDFLKKYKLKLDSPASSNFSQCGPATFMDKQM